MIAREIVTPHRIRSFVKLGRPLFLVGGVVLYGLGAAVAQDAGAHVDLSRFVFGQLIVTATQLMTHYANDYFDLEADRANLTPTRWSGGSRVLSDGVLPPVAAIAAATALGSLALATALILAWRVPGLPLIAPIAVPMIALAWGYSAPPLRLAARGLGEATTAIVVAVLVPLLGYYLQAGTVAGPIVAAVVLPCALQFAMLLAIELPDAAGDAVAGKRTLVVRLGAPVGARLYAVFTVAGFCALPLIAGWALPVRVALAPLVLAPIAIWQATRVVRGAYRDPARWESVAFWSVVLMIGGSAAELIATIAGG